MTSARIAIVVFAATAAALLVAGEDLFQPGRLEDLEENMMAIQAVATDSVPAATVPEGRDAEENAEFGKRIPSSSSGEEEIGKVPENSSRETERRPGTLQLTNGGYRRPFPLRNHPGATEEGVPRSVPEVVYYPSALSTPGYFATARQQNSIPVPFLQRSFGPPVVPSNGMEQLFRPPATGPLIDLFQDGYGFEPVGDNSRQDVSTFVVQNTPVMEPASEFYGPLLGNFLHSPMSYYQQRGVDSFPLWDERRKSSSEEMANKTIGASSSEENQPAVYMRFPTREAGYATEENLPQQNSSSSEEARTVLGDPYRSALERVRQDRMRSPPGFPVRESFFHGYRDGGLDIAGDNYRQYRKRQSAEQEAPSCASADNKTVCFEDPEYPKNDVLYALGSSSILVDRIAPAMEGAVRPSRDNSTYYYACAADVMQGTPRRARNVAGVWKVIVAVDGRMIQPVRTEECRSSAGSCRFADPGVKTLCVQKRAVHRLLSWSPDLGLHLDAYDLPVACACARDP